MRLAPRQLDLFRQPAPGTAARAVTPPAAAATPAILLGAGEPVAALPLPSLVDARPATAPTPLPRAADALASGPFPPAPARPTRQVALQKARELAGRIAAHLGPDFKVHLSVHDNRSTMVSYRRQPPLLRIRLHHMFLEAPDEVVRALGDYTGKGLKTAGSTLDDFIAVCQARIRAEPLKPSLLVARGECHDLQALFDAINDSHFQGGIRARIGWGRHPAKRRRKSIRLGVYDHKAREIRLHPALDRPMVPRFFVEFIVFHEMLHQLFPSERGGGRHVHHPRAFRDRERAWPKYAAAMDWEKQHLSELLRK